MNIHKCQKSTTNPQRLIFSSSRNFMFSITCNFTCCILLASMKVKCSIWTTFVTKIFYEWQILSPKLRHQNFDTKKLRHQNFDTKISTPKNFDTLSTSISKNNANLFLIWFFNSSKRDDNNSNWNNPPVRMNSSASSLKWLMKNSVLITPMTTFSISWKSSGRNWLNVMVSFVGKTSIYFILFLFLSTTFKNYSLFF